MGTQTHTETDTDTHRHTGKQTTRQQNPQSDKYAQNHKAYGKHGLDWIVGPGYSFGMFSTSPFVPPE